MSKIAEQKALEAYPKAKEEPYSTGFINKETLSSSKREGYIEGYDQAMQDVLEKAEKFLSEKVQDYFWWNQEECFLDFDKEECIKEFKNYIENEM